MKQRSVAILFIVYEWLFRFFSAAKMKACASPGNPHFKGGQGDELHNEKRGKKRVYRVIHAREALQNLILTDWQTVQRPQHLLEDQQRNEQQGIDPDIAGSESEHTVQIGAAEATQIVPRHQFEGEEDEEQQPGVGAAIEIGGP